MLWLRREHALLGSEARRGIASLFAVDLKVSVVWLRGGIRFDSRLLGRRATDLGLGENSIQIPLGGELGVHVGGREHAVPSGELASMRTAMWQERWEGSFRVLAVNWTDPPRTVRPFVDIGAIGGADRAALESFADLVEHGVLRGPAASHAVADLLARLGSCGLHVPQRTVESLHIGAPTFGQPLADALSTTMSRLDTSPQIQDVGQALGVSARQVERWMKAIGPWLPPFSQRHGFRRMLRYLRASTAASFFTRPGVSIEQVARSLGYGSARALLLALHEEGLPPPRLLRAC